MGLASPLAHTQTRRALIGAHLLSEPLCTAYGLIAFLLYKELGATPLEIALLVLLKPLVTILSLYWSAGLKGRVDRLKPNVLWAGFWMRAPFLFCPLFPSGWFLIAASVNYMFFFRAGVPAWMELIKRNLPQCNRLFSFSAALGYLEGVGISIALGCWLDHASHQWPWLFFFVALIGLCTLFVQGQIPVEGNGPSPPKKIPWQEIVVRPWRDSYFLMKERRDFAQFQWGYMLCGLGVMVIQPALPLFAVDELRISYLEAAAAISIAKGFGYVLSSPFWARWIERYPLFHVAALVFVCLGSFPFLLSLGGVFLYIAYFCYGIGQGGSHLAWNLSGPLFAGKEESSRFTGVNVALGGIRGMVAPSLGGLLAMALGPTPVLWLGGALCMCGSFYLYRKARYREFLIS